MHRLPWLLPLLATVSLGAGRDKVIVLGIGAPDEPTKKLASIVEEQVLTEFGESGRFEVVGQKELAGVLGLERQRELLGCSNESASCMAELTGALGARFVLMGSLGRIGSKLRLDVKLIDAHAGSAVRRSGKVIDGEEQIFSAVSAVVKELVAALEGRKVTPSASRSVAPWIVGGVGLLGVVVGSAMLGTASVGGAELNKTRATVEWPTASERMAGLQQQYWAGVGVGAVGLLATAGALVWLGASSGSTAETSTKVSVVLTPDAATVALGGTW